MDAQGKEQFGKVWCEMVPGNLCVNWATSVSCDEIWIGKMKIKFSCLNKRNGHDFVSPNAI